MELGQEVVERLDKGKMAEIMYNFPDQCREAFEIAEKVELPESYRDVNKIVVTGLGGSAIGGDLLAGYLAESCKVPVLVNREYTLPAFVDENTLLVAASYSGNTEETLSAYDAAKERRAKIVVITSDGELGKKAEDDGFPFVRIPQGYPPRTAIGYTFLPQLIIVAKLGLASFDMREGEELIGLVEELREKYKPDAEEGNQAKELAKALYGKLPIVYGAGAFAPVAFRWQTQINENSKSLAHSHEFPEMNHNEIVGWEYPETLMRNLAVVFLKDRSYHPRVARRIEITKSLIQEKPAFIAEFSSLGEGLLARLFSLIYLGDWVSFYQVKEEAI